jgi:hypothetical protein
VVVWHTVVTRWCLGRLLPLPSDASDARSSQLKSSCLADTTPSKHLFSCRFLVEQTQRQRPRGQPPWSSCAK